ncbi:MAG: ABC-F family ATP-binding cassette domain-containing protein [Nitriliruptoraceae bacterium]
MHLLSLDDVAATVDGRTLFAGASFGLSSEDRVGVVGPNGVGKTTLLRIVAGVRPPDLGTVVPRSGLRIGWLPQEAELPDDTAAEVVAGGDPLARDDEVAALLDRVGVDPELPVLRASGGQRRRVALARTLLAPSDLLVLDEPTNHLDVDTVDWLEEELRRRRTGLVVVTHDRYVLERTVNRMLDLLPPAPSEPAEVRWHEGTYSSLLEARAQRAAQRQRATARARNLYAKEVAWLRRAPKARGTKPRFRLEQAERLRQAAAGDADAQPLQLGTGARRLGDEVFELEGVSITRGNHQVLAGVDLVIGPGERVGIVGPNGAGKTTLLHLLSGRLAPDEGEVRRGRTVHLGIFEQLASVPPSEVTALDTVLEVGAHVPLRNGEQLPAHRLAERFGFDGRTQRTPVALLSGGERRRLALLHLLVAAPNVVLLDEPTNDLDLDTLAVLEDHLDGFEGTLVVASHDRYLLDRLTDRIVAVEEGTLTEHLDWASYREQAVARREAAEERAAQRASTRSRSAADNARRQAARRRIRQLEQQLTRLAEERAAVLAAMVEAASDPERLMALQSELVAVDGRIHAAEDDWLELTVE